MIVTVAFFALYRVQILCQTQSLSFLLSVFCLTVKIVVLCPF